jgi:hypothetical protein
MYPSVEPQVKNTAPVTAKKNARKPRPKRQSLCSPNIPVEVEVHPVPHLGGLPHGVSLGLGLTLL